MAESVVVKVEQDLQDEDSESDPDLGDALSDSKPEADIAPVELYRPHLFPISQLLENVKQECTHTEDADLEDVNKTKKRRSPNWEERERNLLRILCKPRLKIIENKNTETSNNIKKRKAWEDIHRSFIQLNRRSRSIDELKQQWRCIKMDTRRKSMKNKQAAKDIIVPPEVARGDLPAEYEGDLTMARLQPQDTGTTECDVPSLYEGDIMLPLPSSLLPSLKTDMLPDNTKEEDFEKIRHEELLKMMREEHALKMRHHEQEREWRMERQSWDKQQMDLTRTKLQLEIQLLEQQLVNVGCKNGVNK